MKKLGIVFLLLISRNMISEELKNEKKFEVTLGNYIKVAYKFEQNFTIGMGALTDPEHILWQNNKALSGYPARRKTEKN